MKVYIVTELFDGPYEDIIKVFQKEKDAKDYCDQHNNYLDKEYNPLKEEEIISEIGENNILDQLYENLKSKINIYNNAISEMENYIYKGEQNEGIRNYKRNKKWI